jgi:phosphoglycolate phosphatase
MVPLGEAMEKGNNEAVMPTKRLVIFDLDGTLLDTVLDLADATNHALESCGWPTHPSEAYYNFVGRGINNLFRAALPEQERTEENIGKMRSFFIPYYNVHNTDRSHPYTGIPKLLNTLTERGIAIAVASNKYQQATEKLIRHFFPDVPFAVILGQREGFPMKPDPAIVNLIRERTSTQPDDVLYVGDSGIDMQTATNASVESVGVTWGFRPVNELTENGANHLADIPADILSFL